jgi:hypothetical protein
LKFIKLLKDCPLKIIFVKCSAFEIQYFLTK